MKRKSGRTNPKLVAAVAFGAALGLALVWAANRKNRATRMKEPPGSLGLPFIGETLSYSRNPHRFFEERVRKHGPVFKTRILGRPVVCLAGPKAFSFFASQPSLDRAEGNPPHIRKLLNYHSLPLIDGEAHKQARSAALQVFRHQAVEKYLPIIEETASPFLKSWERLGRFAWVGEYKKLSAALCAALLLGIRPSVKEVEELAQTLDGLLEGIAAVPLNLPGTIYGRALRSRDALLSRIDGAVAMHRARQYEDMLAELLNARTEEGKPLDEQSLRAQLLHMCFAAYGGVFRVLTLMCMNLAQHPQVMERARREVMEHAASGPLNLGALAKLAYLEQVTQEVRRHNRIFASTFFDLAMEPLEYEGYSIPKGWSATGCIYATMQTRTVFENPRQFDPDRFGPGRAEHLRVENAYIPQGGGPVDGHRCPAEDFTTVIMKAIGVLLLRDYTWSLPPQDLTLDDEPSPMPSSGLRVEFRKA